MKCQIMFSAKNKKNKITKLSSAELAKKVVKVKLLRYLVMSTGIRIFRVKYRTPFNANRL